MAERGKKKKRGRELGRMGQRGVGGGRLLGRAKKNREDNKRKKERKRFWAVFFWVFLFCELKHKQV